MNPFTRLRSTFAESTALYTQDDAETARIRAALLGQAMRLTPVMMSTNVGCGILLVACFPAPLEQTMLAWLSLLGVTAGVALLGWCKHHKKQRDKASRRSMHRATCNAGLLAAVWAIPPLAWFHAATSAQQLLLATMVAGLLNAGAYVLSPLPMASLAWAGILTLASLGGLWRANEPAFFGVAVLMALYGPVLAIGVQSASRKHVLVLRSQANAERQQRMVALLLQDFEQNAEEALWETSADGCLSHHSSRLAELLRSGDRALTQEPFLTLLQDWTVEGLQALQEAFDTGRPFRDLQLTLHLDSLNVRYLSVRGKRVLDERGRTLGWRGVLSDVSERVASQRRLKEQAHTDSLTGLANRHTLRHALVDAIKAGEPLALLSIDLDKFKAVNDTLGHVVGDEVLCAVGKRLSQCMRPGDLVARLGGDEFAVVMFHTAKMADVGSLAQRLIDALSEPIEVGDRRLRLGASIGGTLSDRDLAGVDELLVRADMALYAAKDQGRGRYAPYTPDLGERSRRRGDIEQGLRHAMQRGELAVHWQPKVDIAEWKIVGAEALLRWRHPELGNVSPAEFIVVAEQAGLIDEIGHWVLLEACRAGACALSGLVVSVNVSPTQLRDEHYVSRVRDALRETGLDAARLELEITESVFMGNIDGVLERLRALRSLGVRVALDDFGTGYSSLAYLRRFPFDTLKIDRSFISEVLLRKDALAIVQTIASMAATLGMRTVSEGVESAEQLAAVADAGCDEIQGYLVSRAQSLSVFVELMQGWQCQKPVIAQLH